MRGVPLPDEVVQEYLRLRLAGIPQGDAARSVGIRQPRASALDREHHLPTSRSPERVPPANPDWQPIEATCPNCGRTLGVIHAGQRFCPETRHACAQRTRRRLAREATR